MPSKQRKSSYYVPNGHSLKKIKQKPKTMSIVKEENDFLYDTSARIEGIKDALRGDAAARTKNARKVSATPKRASIK